jgi:replication factor C subunit 3/5
MLWVDKHRPMKMDDLSYHQDVTIRLRALTSNSYNMPHLFIYGPSGAGKKTRIATILREIYGPAADKLRLDKRTFVTPTKRTIDVNLITSNYHIELTPGDAGLNDRYVIQEIVKEMASNKNIISSTMTTTTSNNTTEDTTTGIKSHNKRPEYKTIVLMDCDTISRQAQAALRRTMEKYSTYCRFILCCDSNHQCNVMEPLRSRCFGIRIPAPSISDVSFYYCILFIT